MTRTTWLQARLVETPCDLPRRFDAKRPSAQGAAESPERSEHSFRRCGHRREAEGAGGPGGAGAERYRTRHAGRAAKHFRDRSRDRRASRRLNVLHGPGPNRYTSMSTPTGQWSDPRSSGQMKASRTRFIAAGEART